MTCEYVTVAPAGAVKLQLTPPPLSWKVVQSQVSGKAV